MNTDLANRASDDICREINACTTKLAQVEKKAQDWRDTRRQYLQELKDKFPDIWLKEVKEKCHIGRAMAYRILRLPPPGAEKSSTNNDAESTSRQPEYSTDEEKAERHEERWTEEDYANQIVRDVEGEVANLEDVVADLDLVRELILQKLTFAFGRGRREVAPAVLNANAESAEPRKRGRPPGAKNKPKESPEPATDTDTTTGNGVDPEDSAKERAAHYGDEDLSNPNHPLHRSAPDQAVQP
jgi:hypothetical protein